MASAAVTRDLLMYMLWADRLTLASVRQVTSDDLAREAGVSFKSLLGTLGHMLGVAAAVARPLPRRPRRQRPVLRPVPGPPLLDRRLGGDGLADRGLRRQPLRRAARGAGHLDLAARRRQPHPAALAGVVHLVNHTTYHRGQVVSLLRQMGYATPTTDLVYFFAERAAAG